MPQQAMSWISLMALVMVSGLGFANPSASTQSYLPEELEASSGFGPALAHSGAASLSDTAAIRLNPAMLYDHKTYDVSGSYFWPTRGRPFYKLSVVDGVTSRWVGALEYTGFSESLKNRQEQNIEADAPTHKRLSVAFAIPTQYFAVGLAGHYAEGLQASDEGFGDQQEQIKGVSLGAGFVAMLFPGFRIAGSLENFNNRQIAALAPRTTRLGLSWEDESQTVRVHSDWRQRADEAQRWQLDESQEEVFLVSSQREKIADEKAFLGLQVRTFDLLRLAGAYGRRVRGEDPDSYSLGLGLVQKNFSLAYAASRKNMERASWQSSLHFALSMKI